MALQIILPPATEPVTLTEAKLHCRIDHPDEDSLITGLIIAARQWLELATRRSFITQTLKLSLSGWPQIIQLPHPLLQSISNVAYTNSSGETVMVEPTTYIVVSACQPGEILPSQSWPSTSLAPGLPVQIEYVAGYGDTADAVPQLYRQAILLMVAHWYENREATLPMNLRTVPFAVKSIINIDRIPPIRNEVI